MMSDEVASESGDEGSEEDMSATNGLFSLRYVDGS